MPLAHLDRPAGFETLRAYGGRIFRLDDHVARLAESCAAMRARLPWTPREFAAWLLDSVRESGQPDALLRVAVHVLDGGAGEVVLTVRPFKAHPREWYEKGVRVETAVMRRWTLKAQDPQIKASQFVSGVLAHVDKGERAAHEMVFLGPLGSVAEGSVSNIFIVKLKRILTPPVSSGILRGVTRTAVIETAVASGLEVVERPLTRHELYTADECFITNTSSEILPVSSMDGRTIGGGSPGPVTRALASAFHDAVLESLK